MTNYPAPVRQKHRSHRAERVADRPENRPAIIGVMLNPVLVIDIGACTLTAAIRDASGRVTPLAIDGTTTPPARLVVQAGQPRPARDSDPVTLAQLGPLIERLDVPSR
ncbi:hypothetical protein C5613_30100 [Rhodococcus opacus]|uniref:Uncharacterized protein n=1 Tax=Rhodococcus opacus TaxID=37919 RepID=A0A2S8IXM6_RHOOP|nr:hypothetical protein C5613_30100 [Rhodococcus opacus]